MDSKKAREVLGDARREMDSNRFQRAKNAERKEINVLDFLDGPSVWTAVKKFSGTGDEAFSNWIVQIEDRFDLSEEDLNDAQMIARVKIFLKGAARSYFDELDDNVKADYEQMKQALSRRFASTVSKSLANQRLSSIQQRKGENVMEFAERVRKLVEAATAGEPHAVKAYRQLNDFIRGLEPSIRIMVKKDDPDNYEKAVEKARKFEALLEEEGRLINSAEINRMEVTSERSGEDQMRDEVSRLTQMIGTLAQKVNEVQRGPIQAQLQMYRDTRNPDGKMVCHHCGRTGHRMANCFRKRDGLPPVKPRSERPWQRETQGRQNDNRQINVLDTLGMISYRSIKQFTGAEEESFNDWVRQLEDSFELAEAQLDPSQKAARLKFFLTGPARCYFDGLAAATRNNYANAVASLSARFDGIAARSLANQKLYSINQRPNETVNKYAARVRELVHSATRGLDNAIRDHSLINNFIKGLHPELRITVKREEPEDFEEAVYSARRNEALFEEEGLLAEKPRVRNAEITSSSPMNDLKELKRQITALSDQLVTLQGNCYAQPVNDNRRYMDRRGIAGRDGGFRGQERFTERAPFQRPSDQRSAPGKCFNCGQEGHWSRNCQKGPRINNGLPRQSFQKDNVQQTPRSAFNGRPSGANATPMGNRAAYQGAQDVRVVRGAVNTLTASEVSGTQDEVAKSARPSAEQWTFRPGMGIKPSRQINVMEPATSQKKKVSEVGGITHLLRVMVFICTMVGCLATANLTEIGSAMICHPNASSQLWRMPTKHACQLRVDDGKEKVMIAQLDIYQPNVKRYETRAYHCQKIKTTTTHTECTIIGSANSEHYERKEGYGQLGMPRHPTTDGGCLA